MAIDWTQLLTGLVGAGAGVIGAHQSAGASADAAKMAGIHPYDVNSPFGNLSFKDGKMNVNAGSNPFAALMQQIGASGAANYGYTQNDPMKALTPDVLSKYGSADSAMGGAANQFTGMGNDFFRSLRNMGTDPQAAAQNRYKLLTQAAQPEENRMFQGLENNLFSSGRMGTSGGGEAYRGFAEAAHSADLQRQLAGQDFAMKQQEQMFNMGSGALGAGMDASSNRFNMAGQVLGMADNRRQNMLGNSMNAMNMYQQMFNPLLQFGQLGVTAGGGNPTGAAITAGASQGYYDTIGNGVKQVMPGIAELIAKIRGGHVNTQPVNTGGGAA